MLDLFKAGLKAIVLAEELLTLAADRNQAIVLLLLFAVGEQWFILLFNRFFLFNRLFLLQL